jgi:hypothetical protein
MRSPKAAAILEQFRSFRITLEPVVAGLVPTTSIIGHGARIIGVAGTDPAMTVPRSGSI